MAETQGRFSPHDEHRVAYEPRDVHLKPLIIFGAVLIAGLVLAALAMALLQDRLMARYQSPPARRPAPTLPILEPDPNPRGELQRLRQYEQQLLYGGPEEVDGRPGVVRVPIDRAMEMLLEQGLPAGASRSGADQPAEDETAEGETADGEAAEDQALEDEAFEGGTLEGETGAGETGAGETGAAGGGDAGRTGKSPSTSANGEDASCDG